MTEIVIKIDCGKKWCGICRFVYGQFMQPFCDYFKESLLSITGDYPKSDKDLETYQYDYHRLPSCLAAEVRPPEESLDDYAKKLAKDMFSALKQDET